MGSGDLDLFPLAVRPTGVSLATVWAPWLLMGHPKGWFLLPPTPPHPNPPPLLSILMEEMDGKKYHEIQPSEIEKVSYNKNQLITKYFATQHVYVFTKYKAEIGFS